MKEPLDIPSFNKGIYIYIKCTSMHGLFGTRVTLLFSRAGGGEIRKRLG